MYKRDEVIFNRGGISNGFARGRQTLGFPGCSFELRVTRVTLGPLSKSAAPFLFVALVLRALVGPAKELRARQLLHAIAPQSVRPRWPSRRGCAPREIRMIDGKALLRLLKEMPS